MTTNVNDLYLGGRDETLISSIKTPQGFKTEIQGTIDIIDRISGSDNLNDEARVLVNGRNIGDLKKKVILKPADGDTQYAVKADDEEIIVDFNGYSSGSVTLDLPLISDIGTRKYSFSSINAKNNDIFLRVYADNSEIIQNGDWLLGKRVLSKRFQGDISVWRAEKFIYGNCSFDLISDLNTQTIAPVGSGNNWRMVNSHNVHLDKLYLKDVRVASDGNETIDDLKDGYVLNGVTLQANDRVLLKDQTDKSENGIYIVQPDATFSVSRAHDLFYDDVVSTTLIHVNDDDKTYKITNFEDVVDTDDLNIIADGEIGFDVTQQTSITTAVTANGDYGEITTVSSILASNGQISFILNNSKINSLSIIQVWISNYNGAGFPMVIPSNPDTGEVEIQLRNVHNANALNDVIKIGYRII